MTFDWAEYLSLAEGLAAANLDISSQEARYRAAISRAYYAAFGCARNYLRDLERDEKAPRTGWVHQYVINRFNSSPETRRKLIGQMLFELRKKRNAADYEEEFPAIEDNATFSIQKTYSVLQLLVALRQEHESGDKRYYMHPKERILEDLKTAMKAGDATKRDALRLLSSAIKQAEIDSRATLTEEQALALLQTEAKKRRDTISEMTKAGREDIAAKESMELALIESYLPTQLTRDQIADEVRKAISESGAQSAKDMGSVMKVLMPRVKGIADGKLVNEVVKELLK